MANMAKQMELFDEGGLMQEGGTVDPVSGNDVPVGSTQEEVRDDIPAQLSEGEFVMPADVVRYHGLDKMMALRDEAKMGLQRMDAMGQMGNADEATIPDGVPFGMEDLEMEDDGLEMAQGGVVSMANGGNVIPGSNLIGGPITHGMPGFVSGALGTSVGQIGTPSLANTAPPGLLGSPGSPIRSQGFPSMPVFPQVVVYGPDGTAYPNPAAAIAAGVNNYTMTPPTAPAAPTGQAAAPMQAASAQFQPAGTKFTPTTIQPVMPTFQQTIGTGVPGVGSNLPGQDDKKAEEADSPTTVRSTTTRPTDDSDGGAGVAVSGTGVGTATVGSISEFVKSLFGDKDEKTAKPRTLEQTLFDDRGVFGGSTKFGISNSDLRKATGIQAMSQVGSFVPTGAIMSAMAKEFGITKFTPNDIAVAGNTARNTALAHMGYTSPGQLMTDRQASVLGKAMLAGQEAARKGLNADRAVRSVLESDDAIEARKESANNLRDIISPGSTLSQAASGARALASSYREDANQVREGGIVRDSQGRPVTSRATGRAVMSTSARKEMNRLNDIAEALEIASGSMSIQDEINSGYRDAKTGVVDTSRSGFGRGMSDFKDYYEEGDDTPPTGDRGFSVTTGDDFGDDNFSVTSDPSVTATSRTTGESITTNYSQIPDELQTPSTSGESTSDNKIVCTAMNNAYGFGSFRQTVWLQHSKNMDPAYQKGYHCIFKPLIKFAYKDAAWYNMAIRNMLEGIARRRTADIWMQKHGKRHWHGAIERAILEPLCYIVGKIK